MFNSATEGKSRDVAQQRLWVEEQRDKTLHGGRGPGRRGPVCQAKTLMAHPGSQGELWEGIQTQLISSPIQMVCPWPCS